ncbi:MAG: hypothetical protein LBU06_07180 [Desulfovibrio sp.]|nr:hypothetical protein [Desulfovibrio sp.]
MTRKGKLLLVLAVCLVSAALACYPLKWNFFPPQGESMDTGNWKTHCVGRFLIDLPPAIAIEENRTGHIWDEKLVWREDLTPETARQEALAEIDKWRATENKYSKEKMFIESWELPNHGIAIIRWEETTSHVFYASQCYFISNDARQRVFTFTAPFSPSSIESRKNRILSFASGLRARDEGESFPGEEGFCFYGGFLASPDRGEWWGSERAGIVVEFSEYPAITMPFSLWANGIDGPTLLDDYDLQYTGIMLTHGVRVLRRGPVPLGPLKAEEVLLTWKGERGKILYNFMLRVPSEKHRRDRPEVTLRFTSVDYQYDRREPFASEAQALGLWDAISRSIRPRVPSGK